MSKEILKSLQADFPAEAIEKDESNIGWKNGKDIKFIKYIYLVQRLNEVLGIEGWSMEFVPLHVSDENKKPWVVTGKVIISGASVGRREAYGGNKSFDSLASAYKGALTDAFKKCAAFLGVGWKTYAGLLDPDNAAQDEPENEPQEKNEPDYTEQKKAWARCKELAKRVSPDDPWGYVVKFVQTKSPRFNRDGWQTFPIDKVPKVEAALEDYIKADLDKMQIDSTTGEVIEEQKVTAVQIKRLHVLYKQTFADNENERRKFMQEITGKKSTKDLTKIEAMGLIVALEDYDPTGSEWE